MEKVKALVSYNLRHSDKPAMLMMQYGRVSDDYGNVINSTTAQRWRFFGPQIPMPVRSGTWFQGFSADEMLEWLRREGWTLETKVTIGTGYATIYKGNESSAYNDPINVPPLTRGKDSFERVIRELIQDGRKPTAYLMWRYAHGGSLAQAKSAVKALVDKGN